MSSEVATISHEELREKIEGGEDFVLADTLDEHSHLPGVINLPLEEIEEAGQKIPDKETEVVVYCMSPIWSASEEAARGLAAVGYTDVKDYAGGKQDWIRHDLPYEGTDNYREE